MSDKIYRVTQPFAFDVPLGKGLGSRGYSMHKDDLVDETHPAFKHVGLSGGLLEEVTLGSTQHDRIFTAESASVSRAIETATAGPGEKRSVTSPRKG